MATPAKRIGFNRLQYHYEVVSIALDGSGNGSASITWDNSYGTTPVGVVVPPAGANGTWSFTALTATTATLTVAAASDLASQTVDCVYFVHQKL